jgi:hypothetical protein
MPVALHRHGAAKACLGKAGIARVQIDTLPDFELHSTQMRVLIKQPTNGRRAPTTTAWAAQRPCSNPFKNSRSPASFSSLLLFLKTNPARAARKATESSDSVLLVHYTRRQ